MTEQRAVVRLQMTVEVEITDGGYLRNAVLEDHVSAAIETASRWTWWVKKSNREEYEQMHAKPTLMSVTLLPKD